MNNPTMLETALSVVVPEQTDSYVPVSNKFLIDSVKDHLHSNNFHVTNENYKVSSNGMQLFGTMSIETNNSLMVKEIGFRNSYDKSLSVGFCTGAKVIVCSNLMFKGDIF